MAYDIQLADLVREIIAETHSNVEEKKMFGGLCFMVNGKMCVGVETERLMIRFDPALTEKVMEMNGVGPMDFTKRVMKGFAFVEKDAVKNKRDLRRLIDLALDFNAWAKASKPKRARA